MCTRIEAEEIVRVYLNSMERSGSIPLMVMNEETLEFDFGWVFFYNSKEYLETGNYSWMLAGNAPLIIDRTTGTLHITGTANSVEYYIDEYRKKIKRQTN
jgi:Immunity protein 35